MMDVCSAMFGVALVSAFVGFAGGVTVMYIKHLEYRLKEKIR